jgi:hypothetical protein
MDAVCFACWWCRLTAALKLKRKPDALAAARALGNADAWRQVAAAALEQLDVPLAVAAYRQVNMHACEAGLRCCGQMLIPAQSL